MATTTYLVQGMTCGHCAASVSSEIGGIHGVTDVAVNLASGTVTVTSVDVLEERSVRAAIDEAGFELVAH